MTPAGGTGADRDAGPTRTCVGCRTRAPAADLLRVVVRGSVVQPDERRRLPGRGAHLHRDPACLALAERRRALPRALRVAGPLDLTALREWYVGQLLATPADGQASTT